MEDILGPNFESSRTYAYVAVCENIIHVHVADRTGCQGDGLLGHVVGFI